MRLSCLKTHFRQLNHSIDIPAHTLLFQCAINFNSYNERQCVVSLIPLFSNVKSKVFRRYQATSDILPYFCMAYFSKIMLKSLKYARGMP